MKIQTRFFVLVAVLALVASMMFVSAAKDNTTDDANKTVEKASEVKNMTYGTCVSENAKIKNTCYETVKSTYKTCLTAAKNQTSPKAALKTCNADSKKALTQCKTDFKNTKKQTCAKIKHTFLETLKYGLK